MSQTKAQLISDLVQALNFTGTSSAPANGMYLSAANTIKLATNSNGRLTIDSSGNMGLAITPDTQGATVDSLQIGSVTNLYNESSDDYTILGNNIYFDGTNNKYIKTQESSRFMQNAGQFWFQQAGSGSADANITYTTPLFIKTGGNVGIGTTDPSVPLNVLTTATDAALFESTAGDANGVQLSLRATSASPADDDKLAVLDFSGKDDAGNNTTYAQIRSHSKDVTNNSEDGDITFHTRHNGSFAERLNLRSSGQLAITKANDGVVSGALQINTTLANYGTIQVRDSNQANIAALQVENANDGTNETNKVIRSVNLGSANWANAAYHAKEHKFRISGETDTENVVLINTTGLDIASAKLLTTGRANIQKGLRTSPTMLVGANDGGSGMNQNSSKHVNICCPQYLSDTQTGGFRLLSGYAGDGTNYCYLGGSDDNITATATHPKNATELRLFTSATATGNGVERIRVDSSGRVSIQGAATRAHLEVRSSGGSNTKLTAVFGADEGVTTGALTDNTDKGCRIGIQHYDTDALPFAWISAASGTSANSINMGGGTSLMNAATSIGIYTAANNTTATGIKRFEIGADGTLHKYWDGTTIQASFGGSGQVNGITAVPSMAATPFVVGRDTGSTRSAHFGGHLKFDSGYGIDFSATADSGVSTPSELLDDYEEGTWTPGLISSNGDMTTSLSYVQGNYVKVGRLVYISGFLYGTRTGGTGNVRVSALPFTVRAGDHYQILITDYSLASYGTDFIGIGGYARNNQTELSLVTRQRTSAAATTVSEWSTSSNNYIYFNVTYLTDT